MKKRKLLKKVMSGSKNIRFEEFVQLIEAFGFVLKGTKGSHHNFKHPSVPRLLTLQPKNGKAKQYQIKQFLKLIQDYGLSVPDEDKDAGDAQEDNGEE